ncbi:MAG: serine/threonine protein kinase [Candidatus Melainabacteria bacterium]|nr:serine/threonine protein kinase [Candidatus Melainabacteria bacterium]
MSEMGKTSSDMDKQANPDWSRFAPPVQDPNQGFHMLSRAEEEETEKLEVSADWRSITSVDGASSQITEQEQSAEAQALSQALPSAGENPRRPYKDPLIGRCLEDRYHILSVLGWGGMSVVYKARQDPIDRLVAIKTVKFRVDERPDIWRRFEREIKTLSKLSHPNIVTVYDCIIGDDGQPYVVMDFLRGRALDQVLAEEGRFNLASLSRIGAQVAAAVAHAHRHEVIHRDLKPANIMLVEDRSDVFDGADSDTNNGAASDTGGGIGQAAEKNAEGGAGFSGTVSARVVDFGLAKLGEDSRRLTNSGELWGSPPYMSPEQIKGGGIDHRADIYALGAVLFEMATGKDPFYGAEIYELLHKHVYEEPPSLKEACPEGDFPEALELVIAKALAKEPADRFQSMTELKDALVAACSPGVTVDLGPLRDSLQNNRDKLSRASNVRLPAQRSQNNLAALSSPEARFQRPLGLAFLTLLLVFCALLMARGLRPPALERHVNREHTPARSSRTANPLKPSEPSETAKGGSLKGGASGSAEGTSSSLGDDKGRTHSHRGRAQRASHSKASSHPQSGPSSSNTTSVRPPNSQEPSVKPTKFDILRKMKNPALRKEAGDSI